MGIGFRTKFLIGTEVFILFWFLIFYPFILPWMNNVKLYPLLAVFIFELLFYLTFLVLSFFILGEDNAKHGFKVSFAFFALYHVLDSIEGPFVLNPDGSLTLGQTAIISWDYGVSQLINQVTHITGSMLFYITNVGVVLILLLTAVFIVAPSLLGKIARKILD